MLRFALLATLAFCLTEAAPGGYGYAAPHNGHEASVNRNNALRQLHVNAVANHVGSGSGTAYHDGVPGTVLGITGHDRYSYGHGHGHGYGHGYGHGGYGGFGGYGGHGNHYGGHGFHNAGYGGFGGYGNNGFHGHGFHGYSSY